MHGLELPHVLLRYSDALCRAATEPILAFGHHSVPHIGVLVHIDVVDVHYGVVLDDDIIDHPRTTPPTP